MISGDKFEFPTRIEYCTWQNFPKRYLSCMSSSRSLKKRPTSISNSPERALPRSSAREPENRTLPLRRVASSGNVFTDLGFPPAEAEYLRIRSALMIELASIIEKRGLTQQEAANVLGVSQPRVSDIVRGRIARFTIDTLIEMLGRLGVSVSLTTI
jgi:predicted XRE-type DNA-binding protein